MAKIFYHIDLECVRQKSKEFQFSGWYVIDNGEKSALKLIADNGDEIPFKLEKVRREDVKQSMKSIGELSENVGFNVIVEKPQEMFDKYKYFDAVVFYGEKQKKIIFHKKISDLRHECEKGEITACIDTVVKRNNIIQISGWGVSKSDDCKITVNNENGDEIEAKISREKRKDVAKIFDLKEDVMAGFQISIPRECVLDKKIILKITAGEDSYEKEFNINEIDLRSTPMGRVWKIMKPSKAGFNINYIRQNGWRAFRRLILNMYYEDEIDYPVWFANQRVTEKVLKTQREKKFDYNPLISIAIPLYNTPIPFLKDILESVVNQSYANWQLCLADGSTTDDVQKYIEEHYLAEKRIVYQRLKENMGIAGNTNASLNMATGDFVMLADHDDVLELDALYEMVKALNENPEIDIIYTDEDLTDETGERFDSPRFKPDYNINFLRSVNYICHIFMVRKSIMDEVGGFREEFDGAQDWDLILRCCEKTQKIVHIPRILYHWRAHEMSTAGNPESKLYAIDAGKRALEEHYKRMGIEAELDYTGIFILFRSRLKVQGEPKVSIIIPNKDQVSTLNTCVISIVEKTTYSNYEIIIVENNSEEDETFKYYGELEKKYENIKVVYYKGDFNYSKINNFGIKYATGDYYILLNNDTEVITPTWMSQMLGYCQSKDVGIVGAKLYYPDDTVQHCGVVIGVGGFAGHILTQSTKDDRGYFGRLQAIQDISAVTAACLMIKKSVFEEVEGLDEEFKVALNDVDLCLKVREKGYKIIMNPAVELYHYESKSRGMEETPEKHERFKREIKRFRNKWKEVIDRGDPYYNPNLTLMYGDCRIRSRFEHFDIIDEIERKS